MPATLSKFLSVYRLPILAGLLIGTSYIPFPPWAIFFGLTPLFIFWKTAISPRQAFFAGWITQFILNLIGFHWIAYTAIEFGHFPVWAGVLALLGFAAIAHLYYPIAGAIAVWVSKKLKLEARWFFPLTFVLFALCESFFPMIFPWHLGYPWLWANWPGAQFADVIGFEGLNLATIGVNACLAFAVIDGLFESKPMNSKKRALNAVGFSITLVLILNLLGIGRAKKWLETDAGFNVVAVQGNIGNFDKLMAERGRNFREPIVNKYLELSTKALAEFKNVDAIIWPETAFPDVLDVPYQNDPSAAKLRNFIMEKRIPLLAGAYSYEASNKATYNAFFYMNETGATPLPPYRKSILLVFGETFPFSQYIPYTDTLFPGLGSFGRGQGPTIVDARLGGENVKIGPQICYEGLYPWFTASLAKQGAEVLTNVTNDSWFGKNFEPKQHLYMTLARAIEFRRPLLRSTNTGITTAILASGEILQQSPIDAEWAGMFQIRYKNDPEHTIYEKIEGIWLWVLAAALILLLAFGRSKEVRPNGKA